MKRTVFQLAGVWALVLLGCGVWVVFRQHESNGVLVLENTDLRSRVAAVVSTQAETARLRDHPPGPATLAAVREERARNQAQIEQLRGKLRAYDQEQQAQSERIKNHLDALKDRTERGSAAEEPTGFHQVPVSGAISLESARDAGLAAPEAVLETWIWAVREQELGTLGKLQLTPDERSGTPLEDYPDPGVAGVRDWLSGVTEAIMVDLQTNAVGQAQVTVQLKRDRDPSPSEMTQLLFQLQRTGDQWKILRMGGRCKIGNIGR